MLENLEKQHLSLRMKGSDVMVIRYAIQDEVAGELRELPKGDCEWPGYSSVYNRLQAIAYRIATAPHCRFSDEHIHTMAVLGCGHEETMKGWLLQMIDRGWKFDNVCPFTCKCAKHGHGISRED